MEEHEPAERNKVLEQFYAENFENNPYIISLSKQLNELAYFVLVKLYMYLNCGRVTQNLICLSFSLCHFFINTISK